MAKKKEPEDPKPRKKPSKEVISQVFTMMAKLGGRARADSLSAAQRKNIARRAAVARWGPKRTQPKKKGDG